MTIEAKMLRANLLILPVLLAVVSVSAVGPAWAQRTNDPNLNHYFMGRQQWEIMDNTPIIKDKTGAPGAPAASGAMPAGAPPLPKAGWQQYSPPPETQPGLSTSLPKVNNGVPTKGPTPGTGLRGKDGKLIVTNKSNKSGKNTGTNAGANKAAANKLPPGVAAQYEPYKKFAVEAPTSAAAGAQSNAQVHGNLVPQAHTDVLHWARQRRQP